MKPPPGTSRERGAEAAPRADERCVVLICDPGGVLGPDAWRAIRDLGCDPVPCRDGGALLEEVVHRRPTVIVFGLRAERVGDLALLQLVRRVAPEVALIPIAAEDSLATRIRMLSLRPIYSAVAPIDPHELREAVDAALTSSRPRPRPAGWLVAPRSPSLT